jgi:hypothetical protein
MAFLVDFMQPATGDASINVPASTFRMALQALVGGSSASKEGVIAPTSSVVVQRGAGANFSVDIQPFQAVIAGEDVTDQGAYVITNTSVSNLSTFSTGGAITAPGSGTRTHRLVAQVRDKKNNGAWTTYDWTPALIQDTGSGEPGEPASSETLAHIVIAAGQPNISNANITQGYQVLRSLIPVDPQQSFQAGAGAWNVTNTWVAFGPGNWSPVTFTVPPSGKVYITIHAGVIGSAGNTAAISWAISGADSVASTFGRCVSAGNAGSVAIRASNRSLVTGLTPGGSDTVTPAWFQNGSGCSDTTDGHLIVEAVQ